MRHRYLVQKLGEAVRLLVGDKPLAERLDSTMVPISVLNQESLPTDMRAEFLAFKRNLVNRDALDDVGRHETSCMAVRLFERAVIANATAKTE